jgi:hypothetical protein
MYNYYQDEDVVLNVDFVFGMPFIHCQAKRMRYKKFKEQWTLIQNILKDEGHYNIFSCIPEGDTKLYKFQEMFGMVELARENGQILFTKEL